MSVVDRPEKRDMLSGAQLDRPDHAGGGCSTETTLFSVIIPTKNRPQDLALTVRSLLAQTVLPAQLVIVDQSSGQEARDEIERQYAECPFRDRITLSYVRDSAVHSGAAARNVAMKLAKGTFWLFLDDDVCLESDFIERIWSVYLAQPEVAGVSGIITNYDAPPRMYRWWAALFVRGPFRDPRQPVYWNAGSLRRAAPIRVDRFGAGLMSFRATDITGLRFDENLRGVSDGEDVDFCMRLKPGTLMMITPQARLVHKRSSTNRSRDHWLRREVCVSVYLYLRHWNTGLENFAFFLWLMLGCSLAAALASLKRLSLQPWTAFLAGLQEGKRVGRSTAPGESSVEDLRG
jgi:GT2 family glycosyltransferase